MTNQPCSMRFLLLPPIAGSGSSPPSHFVGEEERAEEPASARNVNTNRLWCPSPPIRRNGGCLSHGCEAAAARRQDSLMRLEPSAQVGASKASVHFPGCRICAAGLG